MSRSGMLHVHVHVLVSALLLVACGGATPASAPAPAAAAAPGAGAGASAGSGAGATPSLGDATTGTKLKEQGKGDAEKLCAEMNGVLAKRTPELLHRAACVSNTETWLEVGKEKGAKRKAECEKHLKECTADKADGPAAPQLDCAKLARAMPKCEREVVDYRRCIAASVEPLAAVADFGPKLCASATAKPPPAEPARDFCDRFTEACEDMMTAFKPQ